MHENGNECEALLFIHIVPINNPFLAQQKLVHHMKFKVSNSKIKDNAITNKVWSVYQASFTFPRCRLTVEIGIRTALNICKFECTVRIPIFSCKLLNEKSTDFGRKLL